MIETLKIKLIGGMHAHEQWGCTLEVAHDYNFWDLHQTILNAVGFDNDHMFEFRIARSYYSENALRITCDDNELDEKIIDALLSKQKGTQLFYMFDYGDSWLFQINKSRKKPFTEIPNRLYPRVLLESGVKPEQYPSWDDELDQEHTFTII